MTTLTFTSKHLETELMKYITVIVDKGITMTKPGSITYLLYGSTPSRQAISIKMGKFGEKIVKLIVSKSPHLELLDCGVQCIDPTTRKNKDLDLLWKDDTKKIIYYREAKGNLELDSEKLPVTIEKIKEILDIYIQPKYTDYTIDIGVFNWSIYNRDAIKNKLSHIKMCEDKGVKVEHMEDMLKLLEFEWTQPEYEAFFKQIGVCIDKMFL